MVDIIFFKTGHIWGEVERMVRFVLSDFRDVSCNQVMKPSTCYLIIPSLLDLKAVINYDMAEEGSQSVSNTIQLSTPLLSDHCMDYDSPGIVHFKENERPSSSYGC